MYIIPIQLILQHVDLPLHIALLDFQYRDLTECRQLGPNVLETGFHTTEAVIAGACPEDRPYHKRSAETDFPVQGYPRLLLGSVRAH